MKRKSYNNTFTRASVESNATSQIVYHNSKITRLHTYQNRASLTLIQLKTSFEMMNNKNITKIN